MELIKRFYIAVTLLLLIGCVSVISIKGERNRVDTYDKENMIEFDVDIIDTLNVDKDENK